MTSYLLFYLIYSYKNNKVDSYSKKLRKKSLRKKESRKPLRITRLISTPWNILLHIGVAGLSQTFKNNKVHFYIESKLFGLIAEGNCRKPLRITRLIPTK